MAGVVMSLFSHQSIETRGTIFTSNYEISQSHLSTCFKRICFLHSTSISSYSIRSRFSHRYREISYWIGAWRHKMGYRRREMVTEKGMIFQTYRIPVSPSASAWNTRMPMKISRLANAVVERNYLYGYYNYSQSRNIKIVDCNERSNGDFSQETDP